jgi:hypothetical protein
MRIKHAIQVGVLAVGIMLVGWPVGADPGEAVPYMSGGVGKTERSQLSRSAEDYNLKLVFHTREQGAFLAKVNVSIRDASDKLMIKAASDGPWFFVRLPPGQYNVSGEVRGITVGRMVTVPAEGQIQVNYCWPD